MELALRNATIVDGTGRARYQGDVGVDDGRIVAVGLVEERAGEEIDVAGAVVVFRADQLELPRLLQHPAHGGKDLVRGR